MNFRMLNQLRREICIISKYRSHILFPVVIGILFIHVIYQHKKSLFLSRSLDLTTKYLHFYRNQYRNDLSRAFKKCTVDYSFL